MHWQLSVYFCQVKQLNLSCLDQCQFSHNMLQCQVQPCLLLSIHIQIQLHRLSVLLFVLVSLRIYNLLIFTLLTHLLLTFKNPLFFKLHLFAFYYLIFTSNLFQISINRVLLIFFFPLLMIFIFIVVLLEYFSFQNLTASFLVKRHFSVKRSSFRL